MNTTTNNVNNINFLPPNNIMATIILFDLDGTLAYSGKNIDMQMYQTLLKLKNMDYTLGIVGGGEYKKCIKQLDIASKLFTYIFSECGSVIHKLDNNNKFTEISRKDIVQHLGSHLIKKIGDTFLQELSADEYIDTLNYSQYGVSVPLHVDIRSGLIYLSPVGLYSDDTFRNLFIEYDKQVDWRNYLISVLKKEMIGTNIEYTIGGAVGIACYPKSWDKAQVIPHVKFDGFNTIYFFGDKTEPNGNDYPLYQSKQVIGYSVKNPIDTANLINEIFFYDV